MKGFEPMACEIVVQLLDARLVADGGMRIGRAGWRFGRVFAALSVHVIHLLGLGVVGLQLVIGDWPGRREAAVVLDLAEVFLAEPE